MGSVNPAAIMPVFSIFDRTLGMFANRHAKSNTQWELLQRQTLENNRAAQERAIADQKAAYDMKIAEEDRLKALRRAVARQRANFGAQGIGSSGGSSDAVLLGLFSESDEERKRREELDNVRKRAADLDKSYSDATNLLLATQLAKKNSLKQFLFDD